MNESQVDDVDIAFPGLEPLWRLALGGIYEVLYANLLKEQENFLIEAQPEFGDYLTGKQQPNQINAMRAAFALVKASLKGIAMRDGFDWRTGKPNG